MGFRPGAPERKITKSGDIPFAKTDMHAFMKIDPAIEPLKDEIIITKRRISGFSGSDLEVVLRAQGIQNLVLTGYATSGVILLNYTKDSLVDLYEWFKKHVELRPTTENENNETRNQIAKTPLLVKVISIPETTFTEETVSICFDTGIYFGETLIFNVKGLNWIQKLTSTNYIDYAQPLIATKNKKVPINPRGIAEGYARRILNNEVEEGAPIKLFDKLVVDYGNGEL